MAATPSSALKKPPAANPASIPVGMRHSANGEAHAPVASTTMRCIACSPMMRMRTLLSSRYGTGSMHATIAYTVTITADDDELPVVPAEIVARAEPARRRPPRVGTATAVQRSGWEPAPAPGARRAGTSLDAAGWCGVDSAALDQWPAQRHLVAVSGRIVAANTLVNIFAHRR